MSPFNEAVSDEQLTAYLDDEMSDDMRARVEDALESDPQAQRRLERLKLPDGLLERAFDPKAMGVPPMPAALRDKLDMTAGPVPANSNKAPGYLWPMSVAASFALGMLLMTALRPATSGPEQISWVDTVASYQALYVPETLSDQQAPEITQRVLARAQNVLGVNLQAALDVEGLTFKRVQMLSIDSAPLIQMAYLDAQGQPFAFCLTKQSVEDQDQEVRMSFDLATSSWVENGVGFVIVGGQDGSKAEEIAERFRRIL